ncbi:SPFH domain-containing protein [Kibdelosporangium philippinense]|uniref:SPFH domain-containing protein n=1 Tax=Kibdelosporangium philippinense TaxID=211113 RepID=A0ABS8ZKF2_9PSEU|nr:SPFH domain-containing protein [Kibdelosporangium philippinense]MCE7008210.1 SPFH domain-containing protein [Kibdelosporangium philippinense]
MSTDIVEMPAPRVRERNATERNGLPIAGIAFIGELVGAGLLVFAVIQTVEGSKPLGITMIVLVALLILAATTVSIGLTIVEPGEARVLQFLGRYVGTVRTSGLRWVNPFTTRAKVSTRIRNHETAVMKVNELDGNPIEIAAVVVWQVQDTARAMFEVDNFVQFVGTQTETAIRHIANSYPYDSHGSDALSLRDNADEITEKLSAEISARVEPAGVRVIESRLTHLAYAPEIAQAMLRRQQAGAVVAARQLVVEGAVGMVELALDRLAQHDIVELDEERKAAMVSNLLVVLCGDRDAQPVVNTGSLYQ